MSLTLRQKQSFYHELAQFLRTGIPLPEAVEALLPETGGGSMRQLLNRLRKQFQAGESVPDAFSNLQPEIDGMEAALVEAGSNSGRLEQVFNYLSTHFESLAVARERVRKQITWPLIQLHLAVPVRGIYGLASGKMSVNGFLLQCAETYLVFYAIAGVLGALIYALIYLGRESADVDSLLRRIPLLGTLRRNVALSRFCAAFEMQLQAAVNVMDALRASAAASNSALTHREIESALVKVRSGEKVSDALTGSPAFPLALQRVLRIGENTGTLDNDLRQWSEYYRNAALANLEALGNWLSRLVFLLVAIFIGYVIIQVFLDISVRPLQELMKE